MAPQNRHGCCGGVPYPLDGIPEGTTAEQLQALIDGAQMELLRLTHTGGRGGVTQEVN